VKSNYKVKAFDVVRVMLTHPFENHIVREYPIDIVYEDDTLLLINKKPGMVVHPDMETILGL
jgi:23S rRNA pseudouridine1911/1915/1917 synthase